MSVDGSITIYKISSVGGFYPVTKSRQDLLALRV